MSSLLHALRTPSASGYTMASQADDAAAAARAGSDRDTSTVVASSTSHRREDVDAEEKIPLHADALRDSLGPETYFGHAAPEVYNAAGLEPAQGEDAVRNEEAGLEEEKAGLPVAAAQDGARRERRVCGLSRRRFGVLAVVLAVVILAVVLGAVLGTELNRKTSSSGGSSSSSSSSSGSGSGSTSSGSGGSTTLLAPVNITLGDATALTSTVAADGSGVFLYYMNADLIVEELFLSSSTLDDLSTGSSIYGVATSLEAAGVATDSPFAAVSYIYNGNLTKSFFFVNSNQELMTMNATGMNGAWSAAASISNGTVNAIELAALGACASTNESSVQQIQVFYGDATADTLRQVSVSFDSTTWKDIMYFQDSDAIAGVGCAFTYNSSDDTVLDMYYRSTNTTTDGQIAHMVKTWTSDLVESAWTPIANNFQGIEDIVESSAMAVSSDGSATNFIFWQGTGGRVKIAVDAPGSEITNVFNVSDVPWAFYTPFAAAYADQVPLMFIPSVTDAVLNAMSVNDGTGAVLANVTVLANETASS